MHEVTETRARCQEPFLDSRLLDLLRRHRDLTRQRLALTREVADVERQIWLTEQTTRHARDGMALTVVAP